MPRRPAALLLLLALPLAGCVTDGGRASPRPVAAAAPRSHAELGRDADLRSAVQTRVAALGKPWRAVTAEARGSRVMLVGAVIKPEQRRKAEETARAAGAAEVLNELVLAEDRALDLFAPDDARAAQVRRALGFEADGPAVRVVNGVAFVLGAADPAQAAQWRADAGDVDGIKWVVVELSP